MIFMHGNPVPIDLGTLELKPKQMYSLNRGTLVTEEGSVALTKEQEAEVRYKGMKIPSSAYIRAPSIVREAEQATANAFEEKLKTDIAEPTHVESLGKLDISHFAPQPNRPYVKKGRFTSKPVKIKQLKRVTIINRMVIQPCTDRLFAEVLSIIDSLGNKFSTKISFSLGSGKQSFFVNHTRGPLISISEIDIEYARRMTGSTRINAIAAILNHEFAHWAHDSIIRKLDKLNFREIVGSKPLYDMKQHSRSYAWYHEQFAVLVEYGRWGTSIRPLKSLLGIEIVSKYFDLPYLRDYY